MYKPVFDQDRYFMQLLKRFKENSNCSMYQFIAHLH